jgi:hypothetical protein
MPLFRGKKNVGRNIKTEMAAGKPQKQAIAIAMNVAGKDKKGTKATKKSAPDFKKNPMSAFKGKPKGLAKPSGGKR